MIVNYNDYSKYMKIQYIDSSNISMCVPLLKNTGEDYSKDVPVTRVQNTDHYYNSIICGCTYLGNNTSSEMIYNFDNSKAKFSTMFMVSYGNRWDYLDGIKIASIKNLDTNEEYTFNRLDEFVSSVTMASGGSNSSIVISQGNVLAIGIPKMNTWKNIQIRFSGATYNHVWASFKKIDNHTVKYDWERYDYFLLKDNGVYKTIDKDSNSLIEVDKSVLNDNTDVCIDDLNLIKPFLYELSDGLKIITVKKYKITTHGIKNDKELIISNQNLSIVNAETIHNFLFDIYKLNNGNIKFVISNDNGLTWQSWNGSSWDALTNTVPLDGENKIKQYSKLSDSEKIQWNKLKEEIWTSGISTDTTGIDYNIILTNKTIRFAFVLYRPSYADNITLKDTQWLYDKIGVWHKLSEDDIDIAINSNMCTVTPKLQNLNNVKVNILL